MKPMKYVNIHGQAWTPPSEASKKKAAAVRGEYHKGWVVTGFPREDIEEARRKHDEARAQAELSGAPRPLPFSEEMYCRTNKPKKARPKPYEVRSAADACAELLRKSGWVSVMVEPVARAGK